MRLALLILATTTALLSVQGQQTFIAGETHSYTFTSLPRSPGGMWHPGWLTAYLAPNSVQSEDVVLLEMFEGNPGDTLIFSRTYTNTATVFGAGTPFSWWDGTGSFRLTVLAGSIILNEVRVQVTTGPIACPCTTGFTNIVLQPRPRLFLMPQVGHLRIAWETNYPAFALEFAENPFSTTWASVTNAVTLDGPYFAVSLAREERHRCFRLRKN
jgi:hypothetical protein